MVEIIPSILTSDPVELKLMMEALEGLVDRVQIDIVDGAYAANKTIDPSLLENIETTIHLDFHLMTKHPVDWVEKCTRAGADRIIAQIEMMEDQFEYFEKVQEVGIKVGLAVDLETPLENLEQALINDLDVVLVMGVPAGFGGQRFQPTSIDKIKQLAKIRKGDITPFHICADGGETLEIIDDVVASGADEIIVGRKLFQGELVANLEKFRKAANL